MSSTAGNTLLAFTLLAAVAGAQSLAQVQRAHDVAPVGEAAAADAAAPAPFETKLKIAKTDTVIQVGDLHCKTCAKKIARRLYTVKGVMRVRTDVKANIAIVTPQPKKTLDVEALWVAARKAGFPPVKLVGPEGAFEPDPETKDPRPVVEQVAVKPE